MKKNYFAHETTVIDEGCQIGDGCRIWHFTHIMTNCQIGNNCNIGQNVVVSPDVILGENVKVQNNVSIYTGVICEDDVFLGPSMVFTNVINPRSAVIRKNEYLRTLVSKGASIGANATIICGINLGEYSFIGAGAVVTKDVKPYEIVGGIPAKHIKFRLDEALIENVMKTKWWDRDEKWFEQNQTQELELMLSHQL